jgi:hypothetical protein
MIVKVLPLEIPENNPFRHNHDALNRLESVQILT